MARTRAQQNRAIRQEALREQLEAQGHVQHVNEIAEKIGGLDDEDKATPITVQRLKAKADLHLSLIRKYLPDLKSVELTGDDDRPIALSLSDQLRAIAGLGAAGSDAGSGEDSGEAVAASDGPAD